MSTTKTAVLGLTLALACAGAFANNRYAPSFSRIDQRQAQQEQRIRQGERSGQLTAQESRQLIREQVAIARAERMAKADGRFTLQERQHIERLQDIADRHIAQQKHDRQAARG
jgi:hypothetical protein